VKSEHEKWSRDDLMMVDRVQDNGIDPLTGEFERCLEFIGERNI
jgi:dual specificity MAP kinase phosphatase